jgi:lipopolysaccharide transport system permease protein
MPRSNEPLKGATDEVDDRPIAVIRASSSPTELLQSSLRSLWRNRNLLREMTLLRLKVRYRQSLLGWLWAILPPLVLMIAYTVIFSRVLGVKSGGLPYPLFIFAGLVPWSFFATSLSTATAGIVTHRYLISRVAFPREIIPLSYVGAALVDLAIGIIILVLMMIYFGVAPSPNVIYAIPTIGILIICSTALALGCACFQARFRDVGVAMPLVLQLLMFSSPVVYSSDVIPGAFKSIYFANPVAFLIEEFRYSIVSGTALEAFAMLYSFTVSSCLLIVFYYVFKRFDGTLADVV